MFGVLAAATALGVEPMLGITKAQFHTAYECTKRVPDKCGVDFHKETWGCDGPITSASCVSMLQCVWEEQAKCLPKWREEVEKAAKTGNLTTHRECLVKNINQRRGAGRWSHFCDELGTCAEDVDAALDSLDDCMGLRVPEYVTDAANAGVAAVAIGKFTHCMLEEGRYEERYVPDPWGGHYEYVWVGKDTWKCMAESDLTHTVARGLPEPYRTPAVAAADCVQNEFCTGDMSDPQNVDRCLAKVHCTVEQLNKAIGFTLVPVTWVPATDADLQARYVQPAKEMEQCFAAVDFGPAQAACERYAVMASWSGCARELNRVLVKMNACKAKADWIVTMNTPELPYYSVKMPHMAAADAAGIATNITECGSPSQLCSPADPQGCVDAVRCTNGVLRRVLGLAVPDLGEVAPKAAETLSRCMGSKPVRWGKCAEAAARPLVSELKDECADEVNGLLETVVGCVGLAGLPTASLSKVNEETVSEWPRRVARCTDAYVSIDTRSLVSKLDRVACMSRAVSDLFGGSLGEVARAVQNGAELLPCLNRVKAPASADDVDRFVADVGHCAGKVPVQTVTLSPEQQEEMGREVAAQCYPGAMCAGASVSECLSQLECAGRIWKRVAGVDDWPVDQIAKVTRVVWDQAHDGRDTWDCMRLRGAEETAKACDPSKLTNANYPLCIKAAEELTELAQLCGQRAGLIGEGKLVGPNVLPHVDQFLKTADTERAKCLPNGRAPCSGDQLGCVKDVECLMKGINKAAGVRLFPVEWFPADILNAYIDCGKTVGSQCGTLGEGGDDVAAVALKVTCGARVMRQCTASDASVAKLVRVTAEATECLSTNVTRCGFNADPSTWGCGGKLSDSDTDSCYDQVDCTTRTGYNCMVAYWKDSTKIIFPSEVSEKLPPGASTPGGESEPTAGTQGPQPTGTSGGPQWELLLGAGCLFVAAAIGAAFIVVRRRHQKSDEEAPLGEALSDGGIQVAM